MKTLKVYIKNLVEKPDDERFLSINLENEAFRARVSCLNGGIALLRAVGFQKNEAERKLWMPPEDKDVALLTETRGKLEAAIKENA